MIDQLNTKFNFLQEKYPHKNKYYHLRSIYNFLVNFEKIKSNDREKVLFLLNKYLDYALENDINNNIKCREAYYEFINPIGVIYSKNMQFSYLMQPKGLVLIGIILLGICWFFQLNYLFSFIIVTLLTFYIIVFLKKRKSLNVYSYNW